MFMYYDNFFYNCSYKYEDNDFKDRGFLSVNDIYSSRYNFFYLSDIVEEKDKNIKKIFGDNAFIDDYIGVVDKIENDIEIRLYVINSHSYIHYRYDIIIPIYKSNEHKSRLEIIFAKNINVKHDYIFKVFRTTLNCFKLDTNYYHIVYNNDDIVFLKDEKMILNNLKECKFKLDNLLVNGLDGLDGLLKRW